MSFDVERVAAEHASKQARAKAAALPSTTTSSNSTNYASPPSGKHAGGGDVDSQINELYAKRLANQGGSAGTSPNRGAGGNSGSGRADVVGGKVAGESAAENAARVDALLMELFPERMKEDRKKAKQLSGKNKAGKQTYGIGAVNSSKAHDIAHYINASSHNQQPSRYSGAEGNSSSLSPLHDGGSEGGGGGDAVLTSLEAQMRLLRRELKGKDDKLARVTEHSMMLAAHMDRLKGEVRELPYIHA